MQHHPLANASPPLVKSGRHSPAGSAQLAPAPDQPHAVSPFGLIFGNKSLSGSLIGGIQSTQEMLDFCGEHGITSDVEVIPIQKEEVVWLRDWDSADALREALLAWQVRYRSEDRAAQLARLLPAALC